MTRSFAALGLILVACAACSRATAQEPAPRWEHAVFEYAELHGDRERERYRWITAAGVEEAETLQPIWAAVGGAGAPRDTHANQMQLLDLLATQGWELLNGSDTSFVFAGGSAFANRFYVRRRRTR